MRQSERIPSHFPQGGRHGPQRIKSMIISVISLSLTLVFFKIWVIENSLVRKRPNWPWSHIVKAYFTFWDYCFNAPFLNLRSDLFIYRVVSGSDIRHNANESFRKAFKSRSVGLQQRVCKIFIFSMSSRLNAIDRTSNLSPWLLPENTPVIAIKAMNSIGVLVSILSSLTTLISWTYSPCYNLSS